MALGKLTEAQLIFCTEIAKGKSQPEAYKAAYPKSRTSRALMDREAAKMLKKAAIRVRVEQLRAEGTAQAIKEVAVSRLDVLRELWDTAIRAKQPVPVNNQKGEFTGNYEVSWAAATAAAIAVGRDLGMFKETAQEADPLDGLTHAEVKQVKAILDDFRRSNSAATADTGRKGRTRTRH